MRSDVAAAGMSQTPFRSLARNTLAGLSGRLVTIGLAFFTSTVLFRELGPQLYGRWSILALVVGHSMLLDFGVTGAIEREVARAVSQQDRPAYRRMVDTAVTLAAAASVLLALLVGCIWALDVTPDMRDVLAAVPLAFAMTAISLAIGAVLAGLQEMPTLHWWRSVGVFWASVSTSTLVVLGVHDLSVLLLAYSASGLISAVGSWRRLRHLDPGLTFRVRWHPAEVRAIVRFGGVLQVATMAPVLADYTIRLVLAARFGLAYAGGYDLAARAAIVLRSLAGGLFASIVPFAVGVLESGDRARTRQLTMLAVKYTALFVVPTTVVVMAEATPLVELWLGDVAAGGGVRTALLVLLPAHALAAIVQPHIMIGRAAGAPTIEAVCTASALSLGLLLASVAPTHGTALALFGSGIAAGNVVTAGLVSRRLCLPPGQFWDLGRVALLGVLAWVVIKGLAFAAIPASSGVVALARLLVAGIAVFIVAAGIGMVGAQERAVLASFLRLPRARRSTS
jgi:O-antigen/teichoic acid export membrane protein